MQSTPTITFYGPYCLESDSPDYLLGSKPTSWTGGLYVLAWRYQGADYAHYIGETTRPLYLRVLEHLKGTCSGGYYLYNRQYLDEACRLGSKPIGTEKYLYDPKRFVEDFIPDIDSTWAKEIREYIGSLRFYLGPVEVPDKKTLRAYEAALTSRAYNGSCRYVMDSPPKDVQSAPEPLQSLEAQVAGEAILYGING